MNFSLTESYCKTGYLRSHDQTQLFFRHYAVNDKRALILLVHGFGEHSGRYGHVIDRLRNEGYEVFSIDLRGHGHSGGKRGDVEHFDRYEEDVLSALNHIESNFRSGKKLYLLGHSMGALVGLRMTAKFKHRLDGMILSSPLIGLKMPMTSLEKMASMAVSCVLPGLRVRSRIKGIHLSSDQKIVNAYDNDPLVLKSLSLRAFREILYGVKDMDEILKNMATSFFMQIAGSDPVVDPDAAKIWFSKVDRKRVDATIKIYPGYLHEIYNEALNEEAITDFISWLNHRV